MQHITSGPTCLPACLPHFLSCFCITQIAQFLPQKVFIKLLVCHCHFFICLPVFLLTSIHTAPQRTACLRRYFASVYLASHGEFYDQDLRGGQGPVKEAEQREEDDQHLQLHSQRSFASDPCQKTGLSLLQNYCSFKNRATPPFCARALLQLTWQQLSVSSFLSRQEES